MGNVTIPGSWIMLDNLGAFVQFIADQAKYDLIPDEVQAIELGVRESDAEHDRWYDYEFSGTISVKMRFATDPGTHVLFWGGECPIELRDSINVAAGLMQEYRLSGGRWTHRS